MFCSRVDNSCPPEPILSSFGPFPQYPQPCPQMTTTTWKNESLCQDPYRIEVPVYLEDASRIDPSTLGDPVRCKPDGCCGALASSPAGLADDPIGLASALGGSTTTFSQPNSATSSVTWLDPELQVASRQSSGSDLGPRPSYSSGSSTQDDEQPAFCLLAYEETVEAIVLFDQGVCKGLPSVKAPRPHVILGNEPTDGHAPNGKMLPVYQNLNNDMGDARVPGLNVRPTRVHSNTLPQPSNQYNLSALLAQFKLEKSKSPAAGARPPSPHRTIVKSSSSIGGHCLARSQPPRHYLRTASAPVPDDEPRSVVMIPGMPRKA